MREVVNQNCDHFSCHDNLSEGTCLCKRVLSSIRVMADITILEPSAKEISDKISDKTVTNGKTVKQAPVSSNGTSANGASQNFSRQNETNGVNPSQEKAPMD